MAVILKQNKPNQTKTRDYFISGFTDEDLEKPNFPGKQSSEKVPFILSDVDNQPIVQVSQKYLLFRSVASTE
jgi:hypothetical protein